VAEFNFQIEYFDSSILELRPSRGYHWRTDFSDSGFSDGKVSDSIFAIRFGPRIISTEEETFAHALSFDEFRCGSVAIVEAHAFTSSDGMQQSMRANVNRAYTYEE
jgi:hypothetical protein